MKQVVLKYGLFGAAIFAVLLSIETSLMSRIDPNTSELLGYTTMVLAFLMVFFGIRSYRDSVAKGALTFGKAFQVGVLIALVATAGYVAAWEVMYYNFMPDFGEKYAQIAIEKMKSSGATPEVIASKTAELQKFAEDYKKPLVNISYTFIEAFPVGLIFALISAAILRRRESPLLARGLT